MARKTREEIVESLQAGETTLAKAVKLKNARTARIEEFVKADDRRGNRQTPALCRKASVAPWLEIRHMTERQLARLEAVLEEEEPDFSGPSGLPPGRLVNP